MYLYFAVKVDRVVVPHYEEQQAHSLLSSSIVVDSNIVLFYGCNEMLLFAM